VRKCMPAAQSGASNAAAAILQRTGISNVQKDTPLSVDPAPARMIFLCKIVNCHANSANQHRAGEDSRARLRFGYTIGGP
jgi:hypothetical protein